MWERAWRCRTIRRGARRRIDITPGCRGVLSDVPTAAGTADRTANDGCREPDVRDDSFDCVPFPTTFRHTQSDRLLREVRRVCRSGGRSSWSIISAGSEGGRGGKPATKFSGSVGFRSDFDFENTSAASDWTSNRSNRPSARPFESRGDPECLSRDRRLAGAVFELMLWVLGARGVLWVYVDVFGAGSTSILPHLRITFSLVLAAGVVAGRDLERRSGPVCAPCCRASRLRPAC